MRSLLAKTFSTLFCLAALAASSSAQAQYYPPPPPAPPPPPGYYYGPSPYRARPYGYAPAELGPHFYVGGSLGGTGILGQSGGPEPLGGGGGYSVYLGMRLPRFAFELGLQQSFHNPVDTFDYFGDFSGRSYVVLTGVTGSGLFHLLGPSVMDPYLQVGLGLYGMGRDLFGVEVAGWGYQAGGGIDFWLGRGLTLGGRVLYRGMFMSDSGASSTTLIHSLTGEFTLAAHFR